MTLNRVQKLLLDNKEAISQRKSALDSLEPGSHIYIAGICGTGTAAVAKLLKLKGFKISGSDRAFYPPMGDVVRAIADKLYEGYSASNLDERPDLVVVGNSLSKDHPEFLRVLEDGISYVSMPEVLGHFLIGSRQECGNSVVVSGTHGKTTTSAAMSVLLELAGKKPGFFVGGFVDILGGGLRCWSEDLKPSERVVVLEGDEYDSACFAKWSKFHSYRPDKLIITSLEFDHADIFSSLQDIIDEFETLVFSMPKGSKVYMYQGCKNLDKLFKKWRGSASLNAELLRYGEDESCDFQLLERRMKKGGQELKMDIRGCPLSVSTPLSGVHNALNILAVVAVGADLSLSESQLQQGMQRFVGVQRRQEKVYEGDDALVFEDFAHHPTAVRLTLQGFRESWPDKRIVAVFEPRSNTSQRAFFQNDYANSFSAADLVYLKTVSGDRGYSKSGEKIVALDTTQLVDDIKGLGKIAASFESVDQILEKVVSEISSGDLIVLMSNGDFGGLKEKLVARLKLIQKPH